MGVEVATMAWRSSKTCEFWGEGTPFAAGAAVGEALLFLAQMGSGDGFEINTERNALCPLLEKIEMKVIIKKSNPTPRVFRDG